MDLIRSKTYAATAEIFQQKNVYHAWAKKIEIPVLANDIGTSTWMSNLHGGDFVIVVTDNFRPSAWINLILIPIC